MALMSKRAPYVELENFLEILLFVNAPGRAGHHAAAVGTPAAHRLGADAGLRQAGTTPAAAFQGRTKDDERPCGMAQS